MAPNNFRLRTFSIAHALLNLAKTLNSAKTKTRQGFALTLSLFLATSSFAQQSSPTGSPDSLDRSPAAATASKTLVSVPAGTRIALVLTNSIQSRSVRRGDDIYAQISSPVTSGNEVVIPPGTFVQGKVDRLERKGRRGELHLQSMSITFPDGYVAPISGPVDLETDEGYALNDPGRGRFIGAFALPAAGAGLGALIGHEAGGKGTNINGMTFNPSGLKSTAIGSMVGLAVGGVASLFLMTSSHNFFLDVGSPVEMVLRQPFSLEQDQVNDAVQQSEQHPVPTQPIAQRPQFRPQPDNDPGICYTPGTPGTPDVDIPGMPPIGDSPGTPSTHIPGIPATPPTAHPCP